MPSTKSKYQRVEERQEDKSAKPDYEIRLGMKNREEVYLNRAYFLFLDEGKDMVLLKAAEAAIPRTLKLAEILKKRIPGLHQVYSISGVVITDVYSPLEKGLLEVRLERTIAVIEIKLTKNPSAQDKTAPGYQGPITNTQPLTKEDWAGIKENNAVRKQRYLDNQKIREERGEGKGDDRRDDRRGDDRRGERRERGERNYDDDRRERRNYDSRRGDDDRRGERRQDRPRREGGDDRPRRQGGDDRPRRDYDRRQNYEEKPRRPRRDNDDRPRN